MNHNKGSLYFYILGITIWLLATHTGWSQTARTYSAQSYFSLLETQFDVRVSYASTDIEGIEITTLAPKTIDEAQEFVNSARTPFRMAKLSDRYYTVELKEKSSDLVCYTVIDAKYGQALNNATIDILGISFGSVTNAEGKLFIPKRFIGQTAMVNYLGYVPLEITIESQNDCVPLILQEAINQLDPVFLERIFTQGIYRGKDGSFRFTTEDFGLLPGVVEADVLQITQVLPGVASVDETISNINIRGGGNSENLLLWDGIRMYQSGHFFGLISAFNPYITKNVSVYKNGTKSRYGENVSGVLDMTSEDRVAKQFSAKATLNLLHANVFANIPLRKNISLLVAGRRSLNDIYQTPIYASYSERVFQDTEITNVLTSDTQSSIKNQEDFTFFDVNAKLLWDPSPKDRVRLNFLLLDNALRFTENITTNSFSLTETSNLEQQSIGGGFLWSHDWSTNTTTSLQGYSSKYILDAENLDLFTTQNELQTNELLENSVKLTLDHKINNQLNLETGYEWIETGVTNEDITNIPQFRRLRKEVLQSHNVFGQLGVSASKNRLLINSGLRVVHYNKFSSVRIEPRLSIHQKLGGGFALELLAELKSQSTSQTAGFRSDFLGVENRRWALANNDDIPLLKSRQSSAGIVYTKNNWLINAELFSRRVKGITTQGQSFQNQYEFVEAVGNYKAQGIELVINKQWTDFGAWLSYTYMSNDYEFDSLPISEFPNNREIRHSFKGALSYTKDQLSLVLGVQWRSGRPFTAPLNPSLVFTTDDPNIRYNPPNSDNLPSYWRTDFSIKYVVVQKEGLELRLNGAVQNLFDRKNILNRYYQSREGQEGVFTINKVENRSLRITPNVSVEVLF